MKLKTIKLQELILKMYDHKQDPQGKKFAAYMYGLLCFLEVWNSGVLRWRIETKESMDFFWG